MLTGREIREACDLLGWDRHHMQRWTALPMTVVEQWMASPNGGGMTSAEEIVIKEAFRRAGIVFTADGPRLPKGRT